MWETSTRPTHAANATLIDRQWSSRQLSRSGPAWLPPRRPYPCSTIVGGGRCPATYDGVNLMGCAIGPLSKG